MKLAMKGTRGTVRSSFATPTKLVAAAVLAVESLIELEAFAKIARERDVLRAIAMNRQWAPELGVISASRKIPDAAGDLHAM